MYRPISKLTTLTVTVLALLCAGFAQAQAQRETPPPVPKYRIPGTAAEPDRTQRRPNLTERTYDILTSIYEDIGKEEYSTALSKLMSLRDRRLNEYETALVAQTLGFVYAMMERYPDAIQQFQRALQVDQLGHRETQQMLMNVGQLHAMNERWDDAIRMFTRYFYWEENPTPDSLYLMGVSHIQKRDYRGSLVWIERALADSRRPNETWYNLLLAVHMELGDLDAAANTQALIISMWPENARYWEQLAGILRQQNKDADALAVMSMAYQRGLLKEESKLLNLARYYMFREAPYNAARIMSKGMDDGLIARNLETWTLLAQAYEMSRESEQAISALQRAAALSPNGELYLREAQLHYVTDNWDGVIRATQNALNKGGLRRPGRAWMMVGMAAYENKQYQEALRAFRQARDHTDERQRATLWIQYINSELQAQRQLREGF